MAEDLYAILGVSKGASDSEIKSSYRKLARKYHPDVNKEAGAEDKFKSLQKAYSILSDPQKKQQYDQFGVADDSVGGNSGFGGFGGGFGGFESGGFEDIFDAFFGGSGSSRRSTQNSGMEGEDLRYDFSMTLEEVSSGIEREIDVFHLEVDKQSSHKCPECNGLGQVKVVQRTMLGMVSQVTTCPRCKGTGGIKRNKKKKTIKVTVPAGVETGNKLRISREGNEGVNGGANGDLYLFINVKEHQYFERDGINISLSLNIPFTQLVLGCTVDVPILGGKAKLNIPAGTQSGTTFRLKRKGLPSLQGRGQGDQYVEVLASLPKSLSSEEKKIFQNLQSIRNDHQVIDKIEECIVKR